MKVRCKSCGKVVKLPNGQIGRDSLCPECGLSITTPTIKRESKYIPTKGTEPTTTIASKSGKGVIPTRDKTVEVIGWIVTVFVLVMLGAIARAIWEESIIGGIFASAVCIIITIAVGIWFQNKARR